MSQSKFLVTAVQYLLRSLTAIENCFELFLTGSFFFYFKKIAQCVFNQATFLVRTMKILNICVFATRKS